MPAISYLDGDDGDSLGPPADPAATVIVAAPLIPVRRAIRLNTVRTNQGGLSYAMAAV